MIDNYLYTSRVAHAYELDLILTDSERMSPDFTVLTPNGNVYIEFWGLEGQSDYDKNTEKKKRLYEKHDLSLINVRPDDLDNLCLLYTSPSPRDQRGSRMPSSA